jgi:hypothetical protein
MERKAINAFLLDVFTCLAGNRAIQVDGVAYRMKEGTLYAYHDEHKKYKVLISTFNFNSFMKKWTQIPESNKETIRRLANEIRNKDLYDYE